MQASVSRETFAGRTWILRNVIYYMWLSVREVSHCRETNAISSHGQYSFPIWSCRPSENVLTIGIILSKHSQAYKRYRLS